MKSMAGHRIAFATAVLLLGAGQVHGVLVEAYTPANATTNATLTASSANGNVTADAMATGGGLTAVNEANSWNWRGWNGPTTFAAAVTAGNFWNWGFDLNAGSGMNLDLTTMDIRLDRSASPSGPSSFEIKVAVNGGTPLSLLSSTNLSTSGTTFLGVNLSGTPTLAPGDSVVFTLAAWNPANSNGQFDLEPISAGGAGLVVNGDFSTIVTVPEPSAFLFGSLVCGVLGVNYRRKKRSAAVYRAVA